MKPIMCYFKILILQVFADKNMPTFVQNMQYN